MGVNNPYLPDNVRSDEEAIQYLCMMVSALKNQNYTTLTGAGPFTLTGAQMVGTVVELSGSTTAVVLNTATAAQILSAMQALDANAGVGSTATFAVVNDNTASGQVTLTPGTGVTLVGGSTPGVIAISSSRRYQIKMLTTTTASLTVLGA